MGMQHDGKVYKFSCYEIENKVVACKRELSPAFTGELLKGRTGSRNRWGHRKLSKRRAGKITPERDMGKDGLGICKLRGEMTSFIRLDLVGNIRRFYLNTAILLILQVVFLICMEMIKGIKSTGCFEAGISVS